MVPATCTSSRGTVYDPMPVKRETHPVEVSQQGFTGDCGGGWPGITSTVYSGTAPLTSQYPLVGFTVLNPPCRTRPNRGRAVMFTLIESASCERSPRRCDSVWKLSLRRAAAVDVTL